MTLELRPATLNDAARIAAIYAPYVTDSATSFEERVPTEEEMRARIQAIVPRYPYLVAVSAGVVVGYAYASSHRERVAYRWSVDVAIYLDAAVHRQGIGRALYGMLLPTLARQGFVTAYAGVTLPNEASIGLHEAMGFRPLTVYSRVGYKLGQWRDVGWWSRPLNEPADPPREPIPWPALDEQTHEIAAAPQ